MIHMCYTCNISAVAYTYIIHVYTCNHMFHICHLHILYRHLHILHMHLHLKYICIMYIAYILTWLHVLHMHLYASLLRHTRERNPRSPIRTMHKRATKHRAHTDRGYLASTHTHKKKWPCQIMPSNLYSVQPSPSDYDEVKE